MLTPARLNAINSTDTGLDQKVRGQVQVFLTHLTQTPAPPAERRDLTHSGTHTKRGKPVVLPMTRLLSKTEVELKGKRAARRTHGTAGMGVWKKRMPFCNRADRG